MLVALDTLASTVMAVMVLFAAPSFASPSAPSNVCAHHQARACVAVGRDCQSCHGAARTRRRANRPTPVTTGRHQLPVEAFEERRARRLPRRPCGHPPSREGPRPSAALARNMHEIGPAIGVEKEGSARHILDA